MEDQLLHLSTGQGQNKLATILASYLTRDELLKIDIFGINSFWQNHQGPQAFQNSPQGIQNDNVMYQIHFDDSNTDLKIALILKSQIDNPYDVNMIDYIGFKINYRGKFDVLIKISPNPMNPKFISISFGKAINYCSYKGLLDKLYNKETITNNFISMVKTLLATRQGGNEDFRKFVLYLAENREDTNKNGTKQIIGKFEFEIKIDYLAIFSFSIRDIETERIEILFLEQVPMEVYRLLIIFKQIMSDDKTL